MSSLQVANLHLESTANNRIQYVGSNTINIVAGGANVAAVNSSTFGVTATITLPNSPFYRNITTITADYTVGTSFNEMSIGPLDIANGVTVSIDGEWTIV